MEYVLGLDIGTNSIGWAVVESNGEKFSRIVDANSRIIPMDWGTISDFEKGVTKSQTAERTQHRSVRRLIERSKLRRERLFRVLHILKFLPIHFDSAIGWDKNEQKTFGKFINNSEVKIAWKKVDNKHTFLFTDSFNEMLQEFKSHNPEFVLDDKKIPYDWTLYYLRKKALTEKISSHELAWVILQFNQKRGYYQLREELEDNSKKTEEYHKLKVVDVNEREGQKGENIFYDITLENGWIYSRKGNKSLLDLKDKELEIIASFEKLDDGTIKKDKDGNIKISFRAPKEDDWTLKKKRTEQEVEKSKMTPGEFIYNALLENPTLKIKGEYVQTIERKFYKDELNKILKAQSAFHPEFQDRDLYNDCIENLYTNNHAYRQSISERDLQYLIQQDIIFYQRPLKSKKSLISKCSLEERRFVDKNSSEEVKISQLPCIAKSHPLFQEFRLWKFISNLRIYKRQNYVDINGQQILKTDIDVTPKLLQNNDDYTDLFDWLNDKKEIKQKDLLKYPNFNLKKNFSEYRWNYIDDDKKAYPCNETRYAINSRLKKIGADQISDEQIELLWHILYSIDDRNELQLALSKFGKKNKLPIEFAEVFKKHPAYEKSFGSFSHKAIKRLLSLMRIGKYWNSDNIDKITLERISKIIDGEVDGNIRNRVREKAISLRSISDFQGLPEWLASYVIYDRHSEIKEIIKWNSPDDITSYLKTFKQHSMRNPIVEQIVRETLCVVRDIWAKYGEPKEIHIELGRELKNTAEGRKRISESISNNETTNLRIKKLLSEFVDESYNIESVRPSSPYQQELLKIYEQAIIDNSSDLPDYVTQTIKKFTESDMKKQPTKSDIIRYRNWLEQGYRSPYTGQMISLSKLFTHEYEIEHIIPKARYFDDSISNKVICESEVNKLKGSKLAFEFIKAHSGQIVNIGNGKTVNIFTVDEYQDYVKKYFSKSSGKMRKLLLEDIPDDFIQRQLNDTRYISKTIMSLLSNVVRVKDENGEYEQESKSKKVIPTNGAITDRLKQSWGLNDVWNDIVSPRFIALNENTGSNNFGFYESKDGKQFFRTAMPLELQKGFNKKRIDHRHHAMDAIVIACTTLSHVQYINNESAQSANRGQRYALAEKLRHKKNTTRTNTDDSTASIQVYDEFKKPWDSFTQDSKEALSKCTVSFKNNIRIINKSTNSYTKFDNNGIKRNFKQEKGDMWAIRKPLHKDTVYGEVNLRSKKQVNLKNAIANSDNLVRKDLRSYINRKRAEGNTDKAILKFMESNTEAWQREEGEVLYIYTYSKDTEPLVATRKAIDTSFKKETINSVTDPVIRDILIRHLDEYGGGDPNFAFSPEGIINMNENIIKLNNGKFHHPIKKVRLSSTKGQMFSVGSTGAKKSKFVTTAKGSNLVFAVYENKKGKRSFQTIPLNLIIERLKQGEKACPDNKSEKDRLIFHISPNDLVYLPNKEERENGINIDFIDNQRIYKVKSFDGNRATFIPSHIAKTIVDKLELGSHNKIEITTIDNEKVSIKEIAVPINIDRLGRITLL